VQPLPRPEQRRLQRREAAARLRPRAQLLDGRLVLSSAAESLPQIREPAQPCVPPTEYAGAYPLSAVSVSALCCSRRRFSLCMRCWRDHLQAAREGRAGPAVRGSVTRHTAGAALHAGLAVERALHRWRERVLAQVSKQVRGGAAAGGRVERDARAAARGVPGQLQCVAGAREHGDVHVRQQRGVRRVARAPRPHGHAHERVHLAQRARAGLGHAARRGPARRQALAGPSAPHSAWSAGGAGRGRGAKQGSWLHSAHLCAGSASAGTRKLHGAPELQGVSSTSVREPTPASTTFLATCQASSPSMPGAPRSKDNPTQELHWHTSAARPLTHPSARIRAAFNLRGACQTCARAY